MKKTIFFAVILLLLAACAQATKTPEPGITQQAAIEAALRLASTSRPEISGPQVTPSNPRAEKMTMLEAFRRLREGSGVPADRSPDTLVWLVTMDGLWLNEPPCPICSSNPSYPLRHFSFIIDAATGLEIASQASP